MILIAAIAAAIGILSPTMSAPVRLSYARIVHAEAERGHVDPLAVVAVVHHESRWRPGAVSPDGEDYGLGQVRARFRQGCRFDIDPVNSPSEACRAAKSALLDPTTNLRALVFSMGAWKTMCGARVGRSGLREIAHGLGGFRQMCGHRRKNGRWVRMPMPRAVREIVEMRSRL